MEYIELNIDAIEFLEPIFDGKSINDIRRAHGLTDVVGGEMSYIDFLKANQEKLGRAAKLKIIANPFLDA